MNMIESVRSVLRQYLGIRGRARRSEFWWFYLAVQIVTVVLYVFAVVSAGIGSATIPSGSDDGPPFVFFIPIFLFLIVMLALIPPTISVAVRRLHDTNRSGWYYLLSLIPFGGIVLIVFWAEAGTIGPNAHGEDPTGRAFPPVYPAQPYGVVPTPGIHYPHPGQGGYAPHPYPAPGQPYPGQPAYSGQPHPGPPAYPSQPYAGQTAHPDQPAYSGHPTGAQPPSSSDVGSAPAAGAGQPGAGQPTGTGPSGDAPATGRPQEDRGTPPTPPAAPAPPR